MNTCRDCNTEINDTRVCCDPCRDKAKIANIKRAQLNAKTKARQPRQCGMDGCDVMIIPRGRQRYCKSCKVIAQNKRKLKQPHHDDMSIKVDLTPFLTRGLITYSAGRTGCVGSRV